MRVSRLLRRSLLVLAPAALAACLLAPVVAAGGGGVPISIQPQGDGSGQITGSAVGAGTVILCNWDGTSHYGSCGDTAFNSPYYTVTATALPGAVFAGWAGTCPTPAPANVCAFPATTAVTLKPTFVKPKVVVTKDGTGAGTVTSAPAGIDCGVTCTAPFTPGTSVTLTATPQAGSTFAGWGGACTGTGPCTLTTSNPEAAVTATFAGGSAPATSTLTVVKTGSGGGKITSSPAGIACGSACTYAFPPGATVTLTAVPNRGSEVGAWGGACATATGTTCTLALTGAGATVSLAFTAGEVDVQADLIAVRVTRSRLGQRVVKVEVSADERVSAELTLKRGKKTLATRIVRTVRAGDRVLRLVVPQSVGAGKAKLTVELSDAAGGSTASTRTIRLPAPG